jgi:hypothetical protein
MGRSAQGKDYPFWGVWNGGKREDATQNAFLNSEVYARTPKYIVFKRGDEKKKSFIYNEIQIAYINEISGAYPDFTLNTSMKNSFEPHQIVGVQIKVHFINKDECWFETVDPTQYTKKSIGITILKGQQEPYWRARKIEKPFEEEQ